LDLVLNMSTKDEGVQDRYFEKKQKKRLNWENLLDKCEKCGGTNMEKMNLFQGMFKKGQGKNYQMYRCKNCKHEVYKEI
jgi:predicted nucleic-acid-binding Zn-ribbon protein